ncbi:MAG: alkylhydroperoxidase AhpD family core protein 7 [Hyphomicrobiales bacterium]|nr:alkylhydroperoxidase AhpD family core protein 7 [Hyphomicrobiales bacterium]
MQGPHMANVVLLDDASDADARQLVETLKSGRRGSLLGIYRALLHNPKLAGTWFEHLNAVRWGTSLSDRLRELVIIRVGWRLDSRYILKQHVPLLALPAGVSEAECAALQKDVLENFSEAETAALAAADELTMHVVLPEALAAQLKRHFDDRQYVELIVLIGTYNMHARFVAGVDLPLET